MYPVVCYRQTPWYHVYVLWVQNPPLPCPTSTAGRDVQPISILIVWRLTLGSVWLGVLNPNHTVRLYVRCPMCMPHVYATCICHHLCMPHGYATCVCFVACQNNCNIITIQDKGWENSRLNIWLNLVIETKITIIIIHKITCTLPGLCMLCRHFKDACSKWQQIISIPDKRWSRYNDYNGV